MSIRSAFAQGALAVSLLAQQNPTPQEQAKIKQIGTQLGLKNNGNAYMSGSEHIIPLTPIEAGNLLDASKSCSDYVSAQLGDVVSGYHVSRLGQKVSSSSETTISFGGRGVETTTRDLGPEDNSSGLLRVESTKLATLSPDNIRRSFGSKVQGIFKKGAGACPVR